MSPVFFGVLAYLVAQVAFGFWYSRRIRTEDDYLVAGRKLGPTIVAASVFATWFGAETCLAAAGEAYRRGLVAATTYPLGYGVAVVLVGILYAAPLRRRAYVTVADLFRDRYGVGIERLFVLLAIPTSVLWAAAQVRAFGQVLSAVSGADPTVTITLAAVVVIVYTMAGGLMADAVSDMVQGAVLVAGLVALAVAVTLAGDAGALSRVPAERLAILPPEVPWLAHVERWAVPVVGSLVAQELIARALAARTPGIARAGTIAGGVLFIAIGILPILAGLAGAVLLPGLADPDQVLILQAERYLPTALFVLFAGALVSAILSTVDSTLLVAGSFAGHNLILSIRPDVSPRARLLVNRGAVVGFGIVA
ncbi:MAG TPA: sodium:solute symporter, partial [Gemmatimonadota bacterium]|nr:sodium:solute symporter [Gemmatimonadota bacterium]